MRFRNLPALVVGAWILIVLQAAAQPETLPNPQDLPKPEPPPAQPLPVVAAPEAPCAPACEKSCTTWKVFWLDHDEICPKLTVKENVHQDVCPTLEVKWRKEQRVCTTMVLKPREVVKEVTCCTMKPVMHTDPCTGCRSTTLEPCTEVKLVKEITYELCPEEKLITVEVPCLQTVDRIVNVKRYELEHGTEKRVFTKGVLVPCEMRERVVVPAKPPCCHD
jgi:hypothetical protein